MRKSERPRCCSYVTGCHSGRRGSSSGRPTCGDLDSENRGACNPAFPGADAVRAVSTGRPVTGPSDWLKNKNPNALTVRRETEEFGWTMKYRRSLIAKNGLLDLSASHFRPPLESAMIRGITIGFRGNVRLLADDVCPRSSSSRLAMRGTPFGQPNLPPEIGGFRIAPPSKTERSIGSLWL
jgi:hypothetical protein